MDIDRNFDGGTRTAAAIRVEVHEGTLGVLPDVRAPWNDCLRAAPEHQQLFSFEWYAAWMSTHACGTDTEGWTGESRILVAYDNDNRACGILPLARKRQHCINWWSLAGYFQPLRGFLCIAGREREVCDALISTMLSMQGGTEIYRLGPLDEAAPECAALLNALQARKANLLSINRGHNIVIRDFPQSSDEFRKSARKRSSLKRLQSYERKMRREGELNIRHFSNPRGAELREMLEACRQIEQASWMPRMGGNMRFVPQQGFDFWEQVCNNRLSDCDQVSVWIGYFNGTPVAFDFSIWGGRICYMIAGNYDERFAHYRVGSIVCMYALENAAHRGALYIDMAPGDIEYKMAWGGQSEGMHVEVFVAPAGILPRMLMKLTDIPQINRVLRTKARA